VLALLAAFGGKIRIRNGLIIVDIMIALGMADGMHYSESHGSVF
jgi:hypothetical protein